MRCEAAQPRLFDAEERRAHLDAPAHGIPAARADDLRRVPVEVLPALVVSTVVVAA